MTPTTNVEEKYVRQGWPSIDRPDLKLPQGWSLSLITSINRIHHHRLSPDGQRLAFIWDRDDLSDVYTLPVGGGWPNRVTTERGPVAYWEDAAPVWSPDGQWLAFAMNGHIHVVSARGGLPRNITEYTTGAGSPVWLPDSAGLIIDIERDQATHLMLTDRDGGGLRALVTIPGDAWEAQPSPNGQQVAFVHRPPDDLNRSDLKLIDLAGGQITPLTGAPRRRDWSPRWSPNGAWLAFLSERSGWNQVWLIRPNGEGLHQLTHLSHDVADIAWSPDGRRLACTINDGGAANLALIDASNGQVDTLSRKLGVYSWPQWSAAGDFLTVEFEAPDQPPDLYRVNVAGGEMVPLTFSNPAALAQQALVTPELVSYRSFDGLEIPAFLYRSPNPNGAAILFPHGGPAGQYMFEWDIFAQYLIAKGYTYLCPNYRGSTGYGLEFEQANYNDWGQGDTQDCLAGGSYLAALAGIDPQRVAIYGGSYGGYMTACCLSRDPEYRFACGVSQYGDANLISSWAQCNRDLRLYSQIFLGHPAKNQPVYLAGSPIYQVDQVQKPVLILHGLEDTVVPPQASEEWVEALHRAGKTYEYKTYPDEPHGFLKRHNRLDVFRRIERFLDWYLLP